MDTCVRSLTRVLVGVVAAGVLAIGASAGVVDPVPLLGGTDKGKTLFVLTGVTATTSLGTVIFCTSLEKSKDQFVAVEVFLEETGDVINDITDPGSVETVSPGETVTWEISDDGQVAATGDDQNIATGGSLIHGSARVVSTGKNLMCTAAVMDSQSTPPDSMTQINVIAKKQKGD